MCDCECSICQPLQPRPSDSPPATAAAAADVLAECPGTASQSAGKASACAGCQNQQLCASGEAAKPDPAIAQIAERLACVKHKILVLSGKGGVRKSTFSAQLAMGLAGMDSQVGLLDIDICRPNQPRMMHLVAAAATAAARRPPNGCFSIGYQAIRDTI